MRESHKHLPIAVAHEPRGDDLVEELHGVGTALADEAAERIEQLEEELRVSRMNEMHEVPEGQRGRE